MIDKSSEHFPLCTICTATLPSRSVRSDSAAKVTWACQAEGRPFRPRRGQMLGVKSRPATANHSPERPGKQLPSRAKHCDGKAKFGVQNGGRREEEARRCRLKPCFNLRWIFHQPVLSGPARLKNKQRFAFLQFLKKHVLIYVEQKLKKWSAVQQIKQTPLTGRFFVVFFTLLV